ncbi:MAG: hypothetical protein AB1611_16720 [bacterium]
MSKKNQYITSSIFDPGHCRDRLRPLAPSLATVQATVSLLLAGFGSYLFVVTFEKKNGRASSVITPAVEKVLPELAIMLPKIEHMPKFRQIR